MQTEPLFDDFLPVPSVPPVPTFAVATFAVAPVVAVAAAVGLDVSTAPLTIAMASKSWLHNLQHRKRNAAKASTLATFASHARRIIAATGDVYVVDFGNRQLRDFVAQLATDGLKPKSIAEITGALKSIIASVVDLNTGEQLHPRMWNLEFIDMPVVNKRDQKTPTVSSQEIEMLIRASSTADGILFALLAGTGLRINEALAIKIGDLNQPASVYDAAAGIIHVKNGLWRGRTQTTPKTAIRRSLHKAPRRFEREAARFCRPSNIRLFVWEPSPTG